MNIHTNGLTWAQIEHAARCAGVHADAWNTSGSRTARMKIDVALSGWSAHMSQSNRSVRAATRDQWGVFISHLYAVPGMAEMIVGPYKSAASFHAVTEGRYALTGHGPRDMWQWALDEVPTERARALVQHDALGGDPFPLRWARPAEFMDMERTERELERALVSWARKAAGPNTGSPVRVVDTRRIGTSIYGNPQFLVTFDSGHQVKTMHNASIAYGIGNRDYREHLHIPVYTGAGYLRDLVRL